MKKEFDYPE
ncbi:Protein of unknown function [Bacillus mycoides]|nr:Protein of unknown function [Bacillus mycoides]